MRAYYFFCVALAITLLSCKRSSDQENPRQDFASITNPLALARAKVESWAATNAASPTNQVFTNMMLTTISSAERTVTNKAALATIDAASFLRQLLKGGRAPGFLKGEHGVLSCDTVWIETNGTAVNVYPAERTFHVLKTGDTYTNNYLVIKESEEVDWKLKRAWRVDLNGNLITEWPVQ